MAQELTHKRKDKELKSKIVLEGPRQKASSLGWQAGVQELEGERGVPGNAALGTCLAPGCCTNQLEAAGVYLHKDQTVQNVVRRGAPDAPPLAEKLMAIDGC